MDDEIPDPPAPNVVPFSQPRSRSVPKSPSPDGTQELLAAMHLAINDAVWSPAHQDEAALQDEQVFLKRFGFDANRVQRGQIIAFKAKSDITDAEIRLLKKSGSLVYNADGVEISAPAAVAAFGYVQIVVLGMLMILPILGLGFKPKLSWPILLGLPVFEMVLLYLLKLSDDVYIRPHRIRKRVMEQVATRTP